jgi:hypothetical protein
MDQFWSWFQQSLIINAINMSVVASAITEITHYFSMFLLVGPILLVDLKIMGIAAPRQNLSDFSKQILPWMWVGFVINTISGFILMGGDAVNFSHARPMHWKFAVILVALVVSIVIYRNVPKWSALPAIPAGIKLLALLSIVLWIGAILSSNEVPALTGLG